MMYLIRNETDRLLYWSNADGWGSLRTATAFTREYAHRVNLPIEGEWVEWSKSGLKSSDEFAGERVEAEMEDRS
jgi:hypothetical protein